MLIIKSRRSCWAIVLLDGSPKFKASCNCVVAVGCECLSSSGGSATFVSARRIFSTCHSGRTLFLARNIREEKKKIYKTKKYWVCNRKPS